MPKVTIWATWLLIILGSLLVVLLAVFIAVMFSENLCWISPYLGLSDKNKTLTFLGIGMGGILLALQAVIANRRAKAMEDTAKAQAKATAEQAKANQNTEQGQRQERLKNAIEHLGHASDSVRLGGAYELFHLAQDTERFVPDRHGHSLRSHPPDNGRSKLSGNASVQTFGRSPKPADPAVRAGSQSLQRSPHQLAGKLAEQS